MSSTSDALLGPRPCRRPPASARPPCLMRPRMAGGGPEGDRTRAGRQLLACPSPLARLRPPVTARASSAGRDRHGACSGCRRTTLLTASSQSHSTPPTATSKYASSATHPSLVRATLTSCPPQGRDILRGSPQDSRGKHPASDIRPSVLMARATNGCAELPRALRIRLL